MDDGHAPRPWIAAGIGIKETEVKVRAKSVSPDQSGHKRPVKVEPRIFRKVDEIVRAICRF